MGLILDENLIFTNINYKDKNDVLNFLSEKLLKQGYVRPGYPKGIIAREQQYPTGLPSQGIGIAIPHTDNDLVNETSVAIGVLENPVIFQSMEDPSVELNIHIVIMLAIKEPHGQIEMLQKIIAIIQNVELTEKITKANDSKEVLALIEPYILSKQIN